MLTEIGVAPILFALHGHGSDGVLCVMWSIYHCIDPEQLLIYGGRDKLDVPVKQYSCREIGEAIWTHCFSFRMAGIMKIVINYYRSYCRMEWSQVWDFDRPKIEGHQFSSRPAADVRYLKYCES